MSPGEKFPMPLESPQLAQVSALHIFVMLEHWQPYLNDNLFGMAEEKAAETNVLPKWAAQPIPCELIMLRGGQE
jgi:hypothetical protein